MQNETTYLQQVPTELKKMKRAQWLSARTTKATERLSPKPFAEEFSGLKNIAFALLYGLSIVSIVTAISFFYFKLVENIGVYPAIGLSILILTGLELLKNALFELAFERTYIYGLGQWQFILFFSAFLMLGGSVYTSLQGAKEAYISLDKTQASQDITHSKKTDSLRTVFQKRIEQERADLNGFRKSVTWQGQINIYDANVVKNINAYQDRIDGFEKEKGRLLHQTSKTHDTQREETAQTAGFNIGFWVTFAGITEVLIVLCNWFLVWYDHQTKQEPELLTGQIPLQNIFKNLQAFAPILTQQPEVLSQYLPVLQQVLTKPQQVLLQEFTSQNQVLAQDLSNKTPIGFERKPQDLPNNLPATLGQAIQQGITDTRILTKAYGVNINTVHQTRQALKECTQAVDLFNQTT